MHPLDNLCRVWPGSRPDSVSLRSLPLYYGAVRVRDATYTIIYVKEESRNRWKEATTHPIRDTSAVDFETAAWLHQKCLDFVRQIHIHLNLCGTLTIYFLSKPAFL